MSIPFRFINPSLKRPVPLATLNYNDVAKIYADYERTISLWEMQRWEMYNKILLTVLKELSNPSRVTIIRISDIPGKLYRL